MIVIPFSHWLCILVGKISSQLILKQVRRVVLFMKLCNLRKMDKKWKVESQHVSSWIWLAQYGSINNHKCSILQVVRSCEWVYRYRSNTTTSSSKSSTICNKISRSYVATVNYFRSFKYIATTFVSTDCLNYSPFLAILICIGQG